MKWRPGNCVPGDMVRVRLGSIYHYGIFVSDSEIIQFGPPPVGLRTPDDRITVISTDASAFCSGSIMEVAVFDRKEKRIPPDETVNRARARLGEGGYNLIHNNCEHFAFECAVGIKRSTQEEEARKRWNSRPILDVYLAAVSKDTVPGRVDNPVRQAELDQTQNVSLRTQRWLVWKLLEYALKRSFGLDASDAGLYKDKAGKWSGNGVFISLSHTDSAVAAVVSNASVGVDIESPVVRNPDKLDAMTRRVLTREEARCFPAGDAAAFISLWTKKECIFKCQGGRHFKPSSIDTSAFAVRTFHVSQPSDVIVSVCGDNLSSARLYEYDGKIARLLSYEEEK